MELIPGGNDIEVNAQNVHDYVRRYAEFRMTKVLDKALKVIPIFFSLYIGKNNHKEALNLLILLKSVLLFNRAKNQSLSFITVRKISTSRSKNRLINLLYIRKCSL